MVATTTIGSNVAVMYIGKHKCMDLLTDPSQTTYYLSEFGGFYDVENLFQFIEKHDFLRTVNLGPVLEEAQNHRLR